MHYLAFDRLEPDTILQRFEVVNKHLIDDAMAKGKGVYVALSHTGAHHVVGSLMIASGYRVAGVRDAREGALRRYLLDKYQKKNKDAVRYFFANSFPRDVYRCYKDNFVVGSAIDVSHLRSEHLKTADATFFREVRPFLVGPMQIAMRCGAPVLQGFMISRPGFRYTFELRGPLIDPDRDDESPETLAKAVQKYARNLEEFTRAHPCHISRI